MPLAIESMDLSGYDLVISSSHAVAKGVITGPDQLHICMCYSPMRYAWDLQHQYLAESGLNHGVRGWMARLMLHKMRNWDVRSATGVDHFVAISKYIARRIEKAYRRPATVVYPPVNTDYFVPGDAKSEFFLTASRLVPYKRVDLIASAFRSLPDRRLIIVGDGPEMAKVKRAAGSNVEIMGWQPIDVVRDLMQRARAFVYAAEEDFGIAVVEAQACGTPVVAYGVGGATETVVGERPFRPKPVAPTGVFFEEQSTESIVRAIHALEGDATMDRDACRASALRFARARFRDEFLRFIQARWDEFRRARG
ncbi:MAG: glycosyltransferase [Longimicrobiales bacterium]